MVKVIYSFHPFFCSHSRFFFSCILSYTSIPLIYTTRRTTPAVLLEFSERRSLSSTKISILSWRVTTPLYSIDFSSITSGILFSRLTPKMLAGNERLVLMGYLQLCVCVLPTLLECSFVGRAVMDSSDILLDLRTKAIWSRG